MAKMCSRITTNMSVEEIFNTMSDGNQDAVSCMKQMFRNNRVSAIQDIFFLDSMGLYGEKICKLWIDCCEQNERRFKETIKAFRKRRFTKKQIIENLSRKEPKPFI